MIRKMEAMDHDVVMDIWLHGNLAAHSFLSPTYWKKQYAMVSQAIQEAEVYVYEENGAVVGFVGLQDTYVAGIFVNEAMQNRGIGKKLIDELKKHKTILQLHVYEKNEKALRFYQREHFAILAKENDAETNAQVYHLMWKA
ncbi:MAG: GNAT family N-acetyltransferase [Longicatena caecimuris]|uniref:GNAT family N-acetyltransferase n=1 Tax=Longicatena caecimuris TaxID=1796635 RepID=UPI00399BB06D